MHLYVALLAIDPFKLGAYTDLAQHHCALVLWFKTSMNRSEVSEVFKAVLKEQTPIKITINGDQHFGPNEDVDVWIVDENKELTKLHKRTYHALVDRGAEFFEDHYQNEDFKAHVTKHPQGGIASGDTYELKQLALIEGKHIEDSQRHKIVFELIDFPVSE